MAKNYVVLRPFTDHGHVFKAGEVWPGLPCGWIYDDILLGRKEAEYKGRLYVDNTARFLADRYVYDGAIEDIWPIYETGKSILFYQHIGLDAVLRETAMSPTLYEKIKAELRYRESGTVEEEPELEEEVAGYPVSELIGKSYDELVAIRGIGDKTAKKILAMGGAE